MNLQINNKSCRKIPIKITKQLWNKNPGQEKTQEKLLKKTHTQASTLNFIKNALNEKNKTKIVYLLMNKIYFINLYWIDFASI